MPRDRCGWCGIEGHQERILDGLNEGVRGRRTVTPIGRTSLTKMEENRFEVLGGGGRGQKYYFGCTCVGFVLLDIVVEAVGQMGLEFRVVYV